MKVQIEEDLILQKIGEKLEEIREIMGCSFQEILNPRVSIKKDLDYMDKSIERIRQMRFPHKPTNTEDSLMHYALLREYEPIGCYDGDEYGFVSDFGTSLSFTDECFAFRSHNKP